MNCPTQNCRYPPYPCQYVMNPGMQTDNYYRRDPKFGYADVFGYGDGFGTTHDGWRDGCYGPCFDGAFGTCGSYYGPRGYYANPGHIGYSGYYASPC